MRRVLAAAAVFGCGCNTILGIGEIRTGAGAADAAPAIDAPVDAPPVPIHAVVVGTDFSHPGHAAELDVRAGTVTKDIAPGAVSSDPVLRHAGAELLVVDRFGSDKVVVLDASSHAVVDTFTLPASSNIQDVAAAGTKLYVPALGSTGILVVDRTNKNVKTIPLLQAVDPDGHPDCVSAFYTGVRVYVACGILDASFQPRGVGKIVVIDPFNDTVLRTIDLPFANPQGFLEPTTPATPATGALTIGTVPSFTDFTTGCLARIALTDPETSDCLITNQKLGGGANHAEADPTGKLEWIASTLYDMTTFQPYGRLVSYDLGSGQLAAPSSEPGRPVVDLAACPDGFVVATERGSAENGARIYHAGPGGALLDVGDLPITGGGVVCF